jgi:hypothetical protein
VCIYLDDILNFSETEEEHLEHLGLVLDVLKRHNLRVQLPRCDFVKKELKFLGHMSQNGLKLDPAKVAVIENWPTVFDVRSFLGLAKYVHQYFRAFSAITSPSTDLLKGLHKQERKGRLIHL